MRGAQTTGETIIADTCGAHGGITVWVATGLQIYEDVYVNMSVYNAYAIVLGTSITTDISKNT